MSSKREMKGHRILYKPAEGDAETPWAEVGSVRTLDAIQDEVSSWRGPALRHGDMVRFVSVSGRERGMYVFDGSSSALVLAPPVSGWDTRRVVPVTWAEVWEDRATSHGMLLACSARGGHVDSRRLAMAACECAAQSVHLVGALRVGEARAAIAAGMSLAISGQGREALLQRNERRNADRNAATSRGEDPIEKLARSSVYHAVDAATTWHGNDGHDDARLAAAYAANAIVLLAWPTGTARSQVEFEARDAYHHEVLQDGGRIVSFRVPLSVAVCAAAGLKDPLPLLLDRINPHARPAAD